MFPMYGAQVQSLVRELDLIVRQTIPRQVDKKSRVPKEEKGVWALERR